MAKEASESKKKIEDIFPEEAREHVNAAREAYRKSYEGFLPPDFIAQRRTARREMLLAVRSVIDAAIDRMEAKHNLIS